MANIKDILNSIKLAIRSKGVSVADCDSPEVYPEKILQIKRTVSDATDTVCIHAYCSSQNTPSKPTGNPYNFSTGAITYPEGWSNPDNLSGNIWESHIVVTSNTSVQNGIVEDWTKPIKIIASYNLEDILDYDALNEEISQKIAEDYQEVYEDYQTAISELQSDVERYKNKTDTLEGEYENLVIKTTEDLNGVTRDIAEQVLNSEGFSTKVTQIVGEDYVTQSTFNQTANSITSRITELDGENGRMSQLEQTVDGINSAVFDPNYTGTSRIEQLADSVSATIQNETSAAAIVAKVNESGSEITLNADKINLTGGQTFINNLINDNSFINNLQVKKLNTVSTEAKILIENGELIVYQYINNTWIKRLSLGFDTFRNKVAIVIYDENGVAIKDLTDAGLNDRTGTASHVVVRQASTMELGEYKQIPETTEQTVGWPNYVAGGLVPCVCDGSMLYKYVAEKVERYIDGVSTGEILYNDPTINSSVTEDHYVSSCYVDGKIFTSQNVDWNNYQDYLADGYYRYKADTPCDYRQNSQGELLTTMHEFDVLTIDNGVITNTRTCVFDTFENIQYTDRTTNICDEVSTPSQWNILIDHISDSSTQVDFVPSEENVEQSAT